MHKPDDHEKHAAAHDPTMAHGPGRDPHDHASAVASDQLVFAPQLGPDKIYRLEYSKDDQHTWSTLAFIEVPALAVSPTETWHVNRTAAADLGSTTDIRLSIAEIGPVSSELLEYAATVVAWSPSSLPLATPPPYPIAPSSSTGRAFEGPYVLRGGTSKTLALYLQITPLAAGTARITLTHWYNPDPSFSPSPVTLDLSGGSVTLRHTLNQSYPGTCRNAPSSLSITP
jgi:hypothetical protein